MHTRVLLAIASSDNHLQQGTTVEAVTHVLEVAAVCFVDGADLLLTVRKHATQMFMLPGGKLEPAESPRAAAVREVHEELGFSCDPARLELLGRWGANAANEADTTMDAHVFVFIGHISPAASAEIEEIRWISLDAGRTARLAPLLVDHVIPALRLRQERPA